MKFIARMIIISLLLLLMTGCGDKSEKSAKINEPAANFDEMNSLDNVTFDITDRSTSNKIDDKNKETNSLISLTNNPYFTEQNFNSVLSSDLSTINGNSLFIKSENTPELTQILTTNRATEPQIKAKERQETLGLIRRHEGFRPKPYWDVNAWRVGYGQDTINGQRVHPGMNISRNQAEGALSDRYYGRERPAVIRQLGTQSFNSLQPQQRAVLGSLQWNYGHVPSRVVRAINSGSCSATASAIRSLRSHDDYINAHRRDDEANIYRTAC